MSETMGNTEVLKTADLKKRFAELEVLKGIDLTVDKGEVVVVLGASGSGKSTLLRCLNFMDLPTSGRIIFDGKPVGAIQSDKVIYSEKELIGLRRHIGMVFQHFNLFPHMTIAENVMEGPKTVLKLNRAECEKRAMNHLEKVGMTEKARAYPSQLSGGQQQRVAIARALVMEPLVMLFDEATSALDPELVGEVLDTMKAFAEEGMTMLIVTHELGFAYTVADRVLFLSAGKIIEQGAPEAVLLRPRREETRNFLRCHGSFRLPEPEV